jgi:hypothetical protein
MDRNISKRFSEEMKLVGFIYWLCSFSSEWSVRKKKKRRAYSYTDGQISVVRERGSKYSGQVEAMPRIIRRKKEERKETKGIIKVAFLLPDDACVRKVDLKGRKEKRNEK